MKKKLIRIILIVILILVALGATFVVSTKEVCCRCDGGYIYIRQCHGGLEIDGKVFETSGCEDTPKGKKQIHKCKRVWKSEKDLPICDKVCSPDESLWDYPILGEDDDIPCDNCE